jgi:hypothetical protein
MSPLQEETKTVSVRIASVVVLALTLAAAGQQSGIKAREILEAHLSHGIGSSPFDSDVWRDETNAALIVRARFGATRSQLETLAGNRDELESRLASLRQHGFVRLDGTLVRAAFPIVIEDAHDLYMHVISEAARRIDAEMRGKWQALLNDLEARGWADWAYHFVWSQTMDSGSTWALMMEQGRVPPLSTVIVWVVYPPHPFKSGTNYYPDTELRDQMLAVTWRPRTADTVGRIGRAWRSIWSAALTGQTTIEEREHLGALGLVDNQRSVRVPTVRRQDVLYARLEALGRDHVQLVARYLPLPELRILAGVDDKLAFAMAYHDVGWEILKRMVDSGMLAPPPALREGAPQDVSMVGVCAVVDAHPTILRELKRALGIK